MDALPFCHLTLSGSKLRTKLPESLGEHLRARRQESGHTQKQAANQIGVNYRTLGLWELGRYEPNTRDRPALYAYLGFCPADPGGTLGRRIRLWREANGLIGQELADRLGIDAGSLRRIEADTPRMARKVIAQATALFVPSSA